MKNASCPICGNPPIAAQRPFCSRGCRDRDLLRWLNEGYRIPGRPHDPSPEGLDTADEHP